MAPSLHLGGSIGEFIYNMQKRIWGNGQSHHFQGIFYCPEAFLLFFFQIFSSAFVKIDGCQVSHQCPQNGMTKKWCKKGKNAFAL